MKSARIRIADGMAHRVRQLRSHWLIGPYAEALTDEDSEIGDFQQTEDPTVLAWLRKHPTAGFAVEWCDHDPGAVPF